jgi:hypothetical protein
LLAATRRPKAEGPYLLENIIKLEIAQKSQKSQKAKKSQKQAIKNDANKVSKKEAVSKRRIGIVAGVTARYHLVLKDYRQSILSLFQRGRRRVSKAFFSMQIHC